MEIPIKKHYIKLDAWGRGYFELDNSVYSDALMAGHYSVPEIKENIKKIKQALRKQRISCKTVKTKTSNLFSTGIDVVVAENNFNQAQKIIEGVVE